MVRVKICGITRLADALEAVRRGADAVGFVFAESPRRVDATAAGKIIRRLPAHVAKVGVFVNEPANSVVRLARKAGLTHVQLHGDETEREVRRLSERGLRVIRVVRVGKSVPRRIRTEAVAVLLDKASTKKYGGTGKSFGWAGLRKLRANRPLIVSGGLTPSNVRKLLKIIRPYAVDVSSGVEQAPGKKSKKLIREFMRNVRK